MKIFEAKELFDYPYCCVCYKQLRPESTVVREKLSYNVCLDCDKKVDWEAIKWKDL